MNLTSKRRSTKIFALRFSIRSRASIGKFHSAEDAVGRGERICIHLDFLRVFCSNGASSDEGIAMSLRFVLLVSWSLPALLLGWIAFHEYATDAQPVVETNSNMRVRMCREHVDTAKANPADDIARQAVKECGDAGYLSRQEVELALD
jgi:hypothetical protein